MRTGWARVSAVFALVVVALVLAACGGGSDAGETQEKATSAQTSSVEGLHKDGVLTVGLRTSTSEPLVRRGTSSVDGLYVDVAGALADELGVSVRFVEARGVTAALEENCDIVMDVSTSEADKVQVVGDVTESAIGLFSLGGDQEEASDEQAAASEKKGQEESAESNDAFVAKVSATDLAGVSIAVQEGSASQRALELSAIGAQEVACDTLDDAFAQLRDGEVAYVACGVSSGAYLGSRYEGVEFVGCLTEPEVMGIAFAKGKGEPQDTLINAFKGIDGDGVLAEVRRRWLGDFPHLTSDSLIVGLPTLTEESEDEEDPWADFNYNDYDSENLGSATMDGSSAGANAATVSNEE